MTYVVDIEIESAAGLVLLASMSLGWQVAKTSDLGWAGRE